MRETLSSSPTRLCVRPESMIVDTLGGICRSMERSGDQTWGQLLSNVIDYITITLQFS
jgi:hypothetical protein